VCAATSAGESGGGLVALLGGGAGGVGIGIFTFCYPKEDFASFFIAGRHCWHDHLVYLQQATERLGASTILKEASSPKVAEKHLREVLDEYGTCIAWVDLGRLPHRGLPSSPMTSGHHLVTVYSANDKTAVIGDLTDERIEIAMTDLTAARGRIKKDKFRQLALRATDSTFNLPAAVVAGLKACHQGLDGDNGPSNARQNFSLRALTSWAKRLTATKGADSWQQVFSPGKRMFVGLTSVCQYVEYYGTGGGLVRPLMADFLQEVGQTLGNAGFVELAATYRKIGDQWSELAHAALPDNVPVFSQCKQVFEQYAKLCHSHGSLEDKRKCWTILRVLEQVAAAEFPLNADQCANLRAEFSERRSATIAGSLLGPGRVPPFSFRINTKGQTHVTKDIGDRCRLCDVGGHRSSGILDRFLRAEFGISQRLAECDEFLDGLRAIVEPVVGHGRRIRLQTRRQVRPSGRDLWGDRNATRPRASTLQS